MFSSKCETFALQVAYAWVTELFSKWWDTSARQKNWKIFVIESATVSATWAYVTPSFAGHYFRVISGEALFILISV